MTDDKRNGKHQLAFAIIGLILIDIIVTQILEPNQTMDVLGWIITTILFCRIAINEEWIR